MATRQRIFFTRLLMPSQRSFRKVSLLLILPLFFNSAVPAFDRGGQALAAGSGAASSSRSHALRQTQTQEAGLEEDLKQRFEQVAAAGLEESVNLLVIRDSDDAATKQALREIVPSWVKVKAPQKINVVPYGTLDKGLAAPPKKGQWHGVLMFRRVATAADVEEIERLVTGLKPMPDSPSMPIALVVYASDRKAYSDRLLGSLQLMRTSQSIVTFFVHRLWEEKPGSLPAGADSDVPAKPAVPLAAVFTGILDQLLESAAKYVVATAPFPAPSDTAGLEEVHVPDTDGSLGRLQEWLARPEVTGGKGIRARVLTGLGRQSYDALVVDQIPSGLVPELAGGLSPLLSRLSSQGPFTWGDVAGGLGAAQMQAKLMFPDLSTILVDAVRWAREDFDPAILTELERQAAETGVDLWSRSPNFLQADAQSVDLRTAVKSPLRLITMMNALAYNEDPLRILANLYNQLEPDGILVTNLYIPVNYARAGDLVKFYEKLQEQLNLQGVAADFRIRDWSAIGAGERNSLGEAGPFFEYSIGMVLGKQENQRLEVIRRPESEPVLVENKTVRDVTYQVAWYGEDPAQAIRVVSAAGPSAELRTGLEEVSARISGLRQVTLGAGQKTVTLSFDTAVLEPLLLSPDQQILVVRTKNNNLYAHDLSKLSADGTALRLWNHSVSKGDVVRFSADARQVLLERPPATKRRLPTTLALDARTGNPTEPSPASVEPNEKITPQQVHVMVLAKSASNLRDALDVVRGELSPKGVDRDQAVGLTDLAMLQRHLGVLKERNITPTLVLVGNEINRVEEARAIVHRDLNPSIPVLAFNKGAPQKLKQPIAKHVISRLISPGQPAAGLEEDPRSRLMTVDEILALVAREEEAASTSNGKMLLYVYGELLEDLGGLQQEIERYAGTGSGAQAAVYVGHEPNLTRIFIGRHRNYLSASPVPPRFDEGKKQLVYFKDSSEAVAFLADHAQVIRLGNQTINLLDIDPQVKEDTLRYAAQKVTPAAHDAQYPVAVVIGRTVWLGYSNDPRLQDIVQMKMSAAAAAELIEQRGIVDWYTEGQKISDIYGTQPNPGWTPQQWIQRIVVQPFGDTEVKLAFGPKGDVQVLAPSDADPKDSVVVSVKMTVAPNYIRGKIPSGENAGDAIERVIYQAIEQWPVTVTTQGNAVYIGRNPFGRQVIHRVVALDGAFTQIEKAGVHWVHIDHFGTVDWNGSNAPRAKFFMRPLVENGQVGLTILGNEAWVSRPTAGLEEKGTNLIIPGAGPVVSVAYNHDPANRTVVVANADGGIFYLSQESGQRQSDKKIQHTGDVLVARFSATGSAILVVSHSFAASYSAPFGSPVVQRRLEFDRPLQISAERFYPGRIALSPGRTSMLVVEDGASSAVIRNLDPERKDAPAGAPRQVMAELKPSQGVPTSVAYRWITPTPRANRDGHLAAVGTSTGTIELLDTRNVERGELNRFMALTGHSKAVISLAFDQKRNRTARKLASGDTVGQIRIWDVYKPETPLVVQHHAQERVQALAFSPSEDILASTGQSGTIYFWNSQTGELRGTIGGGTPIFSMEFSPNGKKITAGFKTGRGKIWTVPTAKAGLEEPKNVSFADALSAVRGALSVRPRLDSIRIVGNKPGEEGEVTIQQYDSSPEGLVQMVERDLRERFGPGAPSALYSIRIDGRQMVIAQPVHVALSIGGTKIAAGVLNQNGLFGEARAQPKPITWVEVRRQSLPAEHSLERSIRAMMDQVEQALQYFDLNADRLAEVGISWAGPGDYDVGQAENEKLEADGLGPNSGVNLGQELERALQTRFGRPIRIQIMHDGAAGALGEHNLPNGALHGQPNGMAVIFGTGIGAGIIQDGKPIYAVLGKVDAFLGEVGWHLVTSDGVNYEYRGTGAKPGLPFPSKPQVGEWSVEQELAGPWLAASFVQKIRGAGFADQTLFEQKITLAMDSMEGLGATRREMVADADQQKFVLQRITELAKDPEGGYASPLARKFIRETGAKFGNALRTFRAAYAAQPFVQGPIVLISTIGENFGVGVTDESGEDLFMRAVRDAAGTEQIFRSKMGYEREFTFSMPTMTATVGMEETLAAFVATTVPAAIRTQTGLIFVNSQGLAVGATLKYASDPLGSPLFRRYVTENARQTKVLNEMGIPNSEIVSTLEQARLDIRTQNLNPRLIGDVTGVPLSLLQEIEKVATLLTPENYDQQQAEKAAQEILRLFL